MKIIFIVFDPRKEGGIGNIGGRAWHGHVLLCYPRYALAEIKDCEISGQDDHERLLVVFSEGLVGAVLVGDEVPLRSGPVSLAHPEVGVRRLSVVAERGDEERLRIHHDDSMEKV